MKAKFNIKIYTYNEKKNQIENYSITCKRPIYGYCKKCNIGFIFLTASVFLSLAVGILCMFLSANDYIPSFSVAICLCAMFILTLLDAIIFAPIFDSDKFKEEMEKIKNVVCVEEIKKSNESYEDCVALKQYHDKKLKLLCYKAIYEKDGESLYEILKIIANAE